jgi:hypothetical protein
MQPKDLARTLEALKLMAEAEEAVGEFYRACGNVPGEERDFWLEAAAEEDTHKRSVQKMEEMISENPDRFSFHRPFNPAATRTFLSFIRQKAAALKQDKIPGERLLFVARDIEGSLLELAYFEIVKTTDPAYEKILREFQTRTAAHKNRMERKIATPPLPP